MIFILVSLTPLWAVEASFLENENSNTQSDKVVTVDSTNFRFSPSEITLNEGESVRFFWSGEFLGHNAVEENGFFDSGDPETNVDYTFNFEIGTNGTYTYVCEPHEQMGMIGTIIVKPSIADSDEEDDDEVKNEAIPGFLFYNVILLLLLVSIIKPKQFV
jgi:plastocyanin